MMSNSRRRPHFVRKTAIHLLNVEARVDDPRRLRHDRELLSASAGLHLQARAIDRTPDDRQE